MHLYGALHLMGVETYAQIIGTPEANPYGETWILIRGVSDPYSKRTAETQSPQKKEARPYTPTSPPP